MVAMLLTSKPAAEQPRVALRQRADFLSQQVQLLPTEPVEFAICVMGGNDDAAAE